MKKQLYTSYYSKSGNHKLATAISLYYPPNFRRRWIPDLAPSHKLLTEYKAGNLTEDEYTIEYLKLLKQRKLDPKVVADSLPEGSILVCYEAPDKFCHRHIVAEWLERGADVTVTEIRDPVLPSVVDELVQF